MRDTSEQVKVYIKKKKFYNNYYYTGKIILLNVDKSYNFPSTHYFKIKFYDKNDKDEFENNLKSFSKSDDLYYDHMIDTTIYYEFMNMGHDDDTGEPIDWSELSIGYITGDPIFYDDSKELLIDYMTRNWTEEDFLC